MGGAGGGKLRIKRGFVNQIVGIDRSKEGPLAGPKLPSVPFAYYLYPVHDTIAIPQ